LLCGFLAQAYGCNYGFGVAAIFIFWVSTYLYGYRYLPPVGTTSVRRHSITADERRTVSQLIRRDDHRHFRVIAFYQLYT